MTNKSDAFLLSGKGGGGPAGYKEQVGPATQVTKGFLPAINDLIPVPWAIHTLYALRLSLSLSLSLSVCVCEDLHTQKKEKKGEGISQSSHCPQKEKKKTITKQSYSTIGETSRIYIYILYYY